jgi:hypothetical protein
MPLVNITKNEDGQTLPEPAAIEVYVPRSDQQSSRPTALVRRGQRLDVDEILARSLPTPGSYATREIKPIVSR